MLKKLLNSNPKLSYFIYKIRNQGLSKNKKGRDFELSNRMLSYNEKLFIENALKGILRETNGDKKSAKDFIENYFNNTEQDYANHMLRFYLDSKCY